MLNRRSIQLNRNLANYPLARDLRTHQLWRPSKPLGKFWVSNLPGDDRVQFRVPRDSAKDLRHTPTAFDMNLLFLCLSKAQETGRSSIEFPSTAAMLSALGRGAHSRNRAQLENALAYWRALRFRHRYWYQPKPKQGHIIKRLPPAVESFEIIGRRVRIKLSHVWATLHSKGFFTRVPLPLPGDAAAQNIVLTMATRIKRGLYAEDVRKAETWEQKHRPTISNFCTKIGMAHSSRREVLRRIIAYEGPLDKWFATHGLKLVAVEQPPHIELILMENKAGALAKGKHTLAKPVDGVKPPPRTAAQEEAWLARDGFLERPEPGWAKKHQKLKKYPPSKKKRKKQRLRDLGELLRGATKNPATMIPKVEVTTEFGHEVNYQLPDESVVPYHLVPDHLKHLLEP